MCRYVKKKGAETAEHIESATWHDGDREIRLHRYRCKVCGEEYVYLQNAIYERCPWCGFRIYHYDPNGGANATAQRV